MTDRFRAALVVAFLAAVVVLAALSPYWYVTGLCGVVFAAAAVYMFRSGDHRPFFLVCAGEPAVVAAVSVDPRAAVALQVLLFATLPGVLSGPRDIAAFAAFALASAGAATIIPGARHALLPLLALTALAGAGGLLVWLASYRFTAQIRRDEV